MGRVGGLEEGQKTQRHAMVDCHNDLVDKMVTSREGGGGILHKVTKPTPFIGGVDRM